MIQFFFCLFLLVPVVVFPLLVFTLSVPLGIVTAVVSVVLAIPLVIAAYAHLDLHRSKSRFDLTDEELEEFSRLVPLLATQPEYSNMRARELRRSTKAAAAEIIRERRGAAASGPPRSDEAGGLSGAPSTHG